MKRVLFILLMISLLTISCTMNQREELPEQNNIPSQAEHSGDKSQLPDISHYSQRFIKAHLAELKDISLETWSPDQQKVAYIVADQLKETGGIFIWQVGEKEPNAVSEIEGKIDGFYWSPNSNYAIADIGMSSLRLGEILDAQTYTKVNSINYVGKPVWSPDGNWLALGQVRYLNPPIEWELDGTVDLVMYNINSKETKIIKKANQKEHFRPLHWHEDGVLEYAYNQMDGNSHRQWYPPEDGTLEVAFKNKILQKYTSPSGKNELILVKNGGGYNAYCQNGKYFALVKKYSYAGSLPDLSWSPQEKYLILGTGPSKISTGYVFDIINGKGVGSVDYLSGPLWSPNGNYFTYTRRGDDIPNANAEGLYFTSDLNIYDLELVGYSTCILKGTEDFYYTAEDWDQDGVEYSRRSNATGEAMENGKYIYARNIISWNLDTGNREVLETFAGQKYDNFNYSTDRKWISFIKHLPSAGDAFPGMPAVYNVETGEIRELDMVFQAVGGWLKTSWFNHSPKVITNQQNLLDINSWEMTEIKVAQNEWILGAKPAPDDTKIAVFSYYHGENTYDVMGLPLNLYIMDSKGKRILTKYETDILPYFNNNIQGLLPVNFTWLDNGTLLLENWREQWEGICDLVKIDIKTGKTTRLKQNVHAPTVAPDNSKIAVVELNGSSRYSSKNIRIIDANGDLITSLNCVDFELDFFNTKMIWSNDSTKLVIKGYKEENNVNRQHVVVYDMEVGSGKVAKLSDNELNYDQKEFLQVSDDGMEIVLSQMGSLEKFAK
ncbi:MAG: hypothetical protein APF76_11060 [Desulfitibacter sp. BRH_c19]|nr:MAG: hypothetical protein APF76_11060 [Desulfitibacter sp. BRH_c19]